MPDRIIRDELLRSHRYRTLSSDTVRLLFQHLLLTVDNLGNAEATTTAIGDVLHRNIDGQTAAKLLSELHDVDLIRCYQIEGKPYLHIPRFRQRLKYLGSKHPRPPANIECNEIKKLIEEYRLKAGHIPSMGGIKAPEVKRSEEKKNKTNTSPSAPGFADFWNTYPATKRRIGMSKCLGIWHREHCETKAAEIVEHVRAMSATAQWREGYEPSTITYLNQKRWEDGLPLEASPAKPRLAYD